MMAFQPASADEPDLPARDVTARMHDVVTRAAGEQKREIEFLEHRVASTSSVDDLPELVWKGRAALVLTLSREDELVVKRLPPFESPDRRDLYARSITAYGQLLESPVGLRVAPQATVAVDGPAGPVLYLLQPAYDEASIGDRLVSDADDETFDRALAQVLRETLRVWHRNAIEREIHTHDSQIGLDARMSNWSIDLSGKRMTATFLDTGTPFIRRLGRDRIDPDIFPDHIPSSPGSFWSRRKPEEELNRYYDLRLVFTDLVAEVGAIAPHRLESAVERANAFLADEASDLGEEPVDMSEVRKALKIEKRRRRDAVPASRK